MPPWARVPSHPPGNAPEHPGAPPLEIEEPAYADVTEMLREIHFIRKSEFFCFFTKHPEEVHLPRHSL